MTIQLRNGMMFNAEKAKKIIERYYQCMGNGVHEYDRTRLEDNSFTREQIEQLVYLINRFGAQMRSKKVINKVINQLIQRKEEIESELARVPLHFSILGSQEEIPWGNLESLFYTCRMPQIGLARMTKILHKKRPNIIPILDSVAMNRLGSLLAKQGIVNIRGEMEKAIYCIKELKKDVDTNKEALIELQNYCREKWYDISVIRVLDILLWSCLGPFKERLCKDC